MYLALPLLYLLLKRFSSGIVVLLLWFVFFAAVPWAPVLSCFPCFMGGFGDYRSDFILCMFLGAVIPNVLDLKKYWLTGDNTPCAGGPHDRVRPASGGALDPRLVNASRSSSRLAPRCARWRPPGTWRRRSDVK